MNSEQARFLKRDGGLLFFVIAALPERRHARAGGYPANLLGYPKNGVPPCAGMARLIQVSEIETGQLFRMRVMVVHEIT